MMFSSNTFAAGVVIDSSSPAPTECLPTPHADLSPPIYLPSPVRYSDGPPDWRSRAVGLGGTFGVVLIVLAAALFTWRLAVPIIPAQPPLVVVNVRSDTVSPDAEEVPEGPRQIEQQASKSVEPDRPPPELSIPRLDPPTPQEVHAESAAAADPVPETTAPKALPAPQAARVANDAKATWESLLLAHLEKHRRYPSASRPRREQGVAHVKFRMNRAGQVLAIEVVRSSGSAALDRAARETIRRAQPLPTIPPDRPAPLELSVPVEFFLN